MARGRFVSTSIAEDIELNSLTMEAHWLYLMTIPHLDRDGLIKGDTYVLFGKVCPRRPEIIPHIESLIGEWVHAKLVIAYPTRDGRVLYFKGFGKNQQGMHYAREAASTLQPPPGYTRTPNGLTPDELRTNSGLSPAEVEVEVEDQGEGEYACAREPEAAAPPTNPPPSYDFQPLPGEYIPGVRRPQHNQAKRNCDSYMAQASKQGIGPEPFRMMVDAVLDATGKRALADTNGDLGQQALNQAKETVVTLLEMGRRTLEDVQAVLVSWREDDYRGASAPSFAQIVEHASAMAAGTHVTTRRQESSKKEFASLADYNDWAARNDPKYQRIREGVLIRGTLIKREQYQPVMAH